MASVSISASVTNIGYRAFQGCGPEILDPRNLFYGSAGGVRFDKNQTTLNRGVVSGNYTISNTVTSITDSAFSRANLTSITIPGSVTTIGDSAFFGCRGLSNVSIANGVAVIGPFAFYNCFSLRSLTMPPALSSLMMVTSGGVPS